MAPALCLLRLNGGRGGSGRGVCPGRRGGDAIAGMAGAAAPAAGRCGGQHGVLAAATGGRSPARRIRPDAIAAAAARRRLPCGRDRAPPRATVSAVAAVRAARLPQWRRPCASAMAPLHGYGSAGGGGGRGGCVPPAPPPQPCAPSAAHRVPTSRPRPLPPVIRRGCGELSCGRHEPFLSERKARTACLPWQRTFLRDPRLLSTSCLSFPLYHKNENRADRGRRRDFSSTGPLLLNERFR